MSIKHVLFAGDAREDPQKHFAAGRCRPPDIGTEIQIGADPAQVGHALVCNDGVTIAKELELEDRRREPRCPDAAPGGGEDRRRRGRRHQHGDRCSRSAIFADGVRNVDRRGQRHRPQTRAGPRACSGGSTRCAAAGPSRERAARRRHRSRPSRPTTILTIGEMVADAMEKVGRDGVITVEESKTIGNHARSGRRHAVRSRLRLALFRNGHEPDAGRPRRRLRPHLRPQAEPAEGPAGASRAGSPSPAGRSLFIAEDIEAECLATLIVNQMRGVLKSVAVKAPGFGDRRKAMLQDIAVLHRRRGRCPKNWA